MEKVVKINEIEVNEKFQSRIGFNVSKLAEYKALIEDGEEFPPISVFKVENRLILVDGFHRQRAYREIGRDEIKVKIVGKGDEREAYLESIKANTKHGMQRSKNDVIKALEKLLEDNEWRKWSEREIARTVSCTTYMVRKIKDKLGIESEVTKYKDKNGNIVESKSQKSKNNDDPMKNMLEIKGFTILKKSEAKKIYKNYVIYCKDKSEKSIENIEKFNTNSSFEIEFEYYKKNWKISEVVLTMLTKYEKNYSIDEDSDKFEKEIKDRNLKILNNKEAEKLFEKMKKNKEKYKKVKLYCKRKKDTIEEADLLNVESNWKDEFSYFKNMKYIENDAITFFTNLTDQLISEKVKNDDKDNSKKVNDIENEEIKIEEIEVEESGLKGIDKEDIFEKEIEAKIRKDIAESIYETDIKKILETETSIKIVMKNGDNEMLTKAEVINDIEIYLLETLKLEDEKFIYTVSYLGDNWIAKVSGTGEIEQKGVTKLEAISNLVNKLF